jgi:hypothetical protein
MHLPYNAFFALFSTFIQGGHLPREGISVVEGHKNI